MRNGAINVDKNILGGTPVFSGTRVPVSILFDYLEDNQMDEFLANYPTVSKEQVLEVIRLASNAVSKEQVSGENLN